MTRDDYQKVVRQVKVLLEGKNDVLIHRLNREMMDHSDALRFEAAAQIREQLKAVRKISGGRRLLMPKPTDIDFFAFKRIDNLAFCELLFVRAGIISGSTHMTMEIHSEITEGQIAEKFLVHYCSRGLPIPFELVLSKQPDNSEPLYRLLCKSRGKSVKLIVPLRGIKAKLLKIAARNLNNRLRITVKTNLGQADLKELRSLLESDSPLETIEAIDISETQGKLAVGSVVTFVKGTPDKKKYRRFRIKKECTSDMERIAEVVDRRLSRAQEPGWELPDLIIIDGGLLQLNAALSILRTHPKVDVRIISLVKDRNRRQHEAIFLRTGREIPLSSDSGAKRILDRIRDEAHRFAITYHRSLRHRTSMRSPIADIPGIGKKRQKLLKKSFGSIERIRKASLSQLASVQGIGPATAKLIRDHFDN